LIFDYFSKICWEVEVSLKSEKNNWYFISRSICVYDDTSLNFSLDEKSIRQKLYRKSKYIFYIQKVLLENYVVYEIVWKNIVLPDKAKMII
jgi:hypothetical protein